MILDSGMDTSENKIQEKENWQKPEVSPDAQTWMKHDFHEVVKIQSTETMMFYKVFWNKRDKRPEGVWRQQSECLVLKSFAIAYRCKRLGILKKESSDEDEHRHMESVDEFND